MYISLCPYARVSPRYIVRKEIARSKDVFSFSVTGSCQIALHSSHTNFLANTSAHLVANETCPSHNDPGQRWQLLLIPTCQEDIGRPREGVMSLTPLVVAIQKLDEPRSLRFQSFITMGTRYKARTQTLQPLLENKRHSHNLYDVVNINSYTH